METRVRIAASLMLAVGLVFTALYLFANKPNGTFGLTTTSLSGRAAVRIAGIDPGGAASAAGLRTGDVLYAADDTTSGRAPLYLFLNLPITAAGDIASVRLERSPGRVVVLQALFNRQSPWIEAVFFALISTPMLLLGWFIVWRKPASSDAVVLGFMLQCFGLAISIPDRVGPVLARLIFYELAASALFILGVYTAVVFFARYTEGSGLRSPFRRRAMLAAGALSILETLMMVATYTLPAYAGDVSYLFVPSVVCVVLTPALAFMCFLDAYRSGTPADRQRLKWIAGSFFLGFSGPLLLPGATLVLGSNYNVIDQVLFSSTFYVLAFGLTYAVLKRRVVDVTFVLNRALVFSLVSGIVVASFIALEWIVGVLFVNLSRPTSFIIEAGVAVVIGFSLRPIHDRADHFIDRVFFAKRHEAEKALRHLATEVNFIRDRDSLLARVERDLTGYLEATSVCMYYRSDVQSDFMQICSTGGTPEFVDADDDAVVGLAVAEAPIELHSRDTSLVGEIAIPMAVRKALVGILVLGHKRTGEAFAPDEVESLCFLAGYLATALAAIPANGPTQSTDTLLRELIAETRMQREELLSIRKRLDLQDERA